MITFAFIMAALILWTLPGFVLARGMYAQAVREISMRHVTVVPPKPERPRIKLNEMLHISGDRWGGTAGRCAILNPTNKRSCNCKYREDWVELKNAWLDYNEWEEKYGHIRNGVAVEPKVNMLPIYMAVPAWPVVAGGMYIRGGSKRIPDYRAIERMELDELRELD